MELDGHSAIVTGAARGIGQAIALELAHRGAGVAVCDVEVDALAKSADRLANAAEVEVIHRVVDIADERAVREFVAEVEERFGGVQILVNNAGIHPLHPIEAISAEEWDTVLTVNLKAQFYFCKAVLPGMRNRRYGRIINIASEAGKNGGTVAAAHYAASKGGVLAFTRNLAQAVGADGITVNAICPGRIASSMAGSADSPQNRRFIENSILKRIGDPADVAFAAAYLASPRAGFITAESMMVNGGTLRD